VAVTAGPAVEAGAITPTPVSLVGRRSQPPTLPDEGGRRDLPAINIAGAEPIEQPAQTVTEKVSGFFWGIFRTILGIVLLPVIILVLFARIIIGKKNLGEALQWTWEWVQRKTQIKRDASQDEKIDAARNADSKLAERLAYLEGKLGIPQGSGQNADGS